jgi:predicted aspartyl protease
MEKSGTTFMAIALGLAMSCCSSLPHAEMKAVSPATMKLLEQRSQKLDDLGIREDGGALVCSANWSAEGPVTVPLLWQHNLPHVTALVNGHPVRLIVDSGSQGCVLEAETALRCGVTTVRASERKFTLSGISGAESALMGVPDHVEIGDWKWSRLPCLVRTGKSEMVGPWPLDRRPFAINILGMNAMRHMCSYLTLDYPRGRVVFGLKEDFKPGTGLKTWSAPLEFREGLPHVKISDGKAEWWALVDSGASTLAEMNAEKAAQLGFQNNSSRSGTARIGVGAPGKDANQTLRQVRVRELTRLGPRLLNVDMLIVPDRSKIGAILRPFRVTFDFNRSLLWLEDPR